MTIRGLIAEVRRDKPGLADLHKVTALVRERITDLDGAIDEMLYSYVVANRDVLPAVQGRSASQHAPDSGQPLPDSGQSSVVQRTSEGPSESGSSRSKKWSRVAAIFLRIEVIDGTHKLLGELTIPDLVWREADLGKRSDELTYQAQRYKTLRWELQRRGVQRVDQLPADVVCSALGRQPREDAA